LDVFLISFSGGSAAYAILFINIACTAEKQERRKYSCLILYIRSAILKCGNLEKAIFACIFIRCGGGINQLNKLV
jgi:hypothetical protein